MNITLKEKISMGTVRQFNRAASTTDLDLMFETYPLLVAKWDLKSDPAKIESYDEIDIADFPALNEALGKALAERFTAKN